MKIPFVGPSATARSPNASVQRTVNGYLEFDNSNPRVPIALYGTPGLYLRLTLGTAPVRGGIRMGSYLYWVAGNTVYRMDTLYATTTLGTISSSSGEVGLACSGTQVLIVDGIGGWYADTTTLTQITDPDFPVGVTRAAYQDSYFIVSGLAGSQSFWWSENPNDASSWDGLDFASAEGSPDGCVNVISDHRELWLFGTETAEIFVNTGDADQLFQRSQNAFLQQGTIAAGTVQAMNNTVYWLGAGKDGQGIAFQAQGYNPLRISTHAIEKEWASYSTMADAKAYCWQIEGHSFYTLIFPTADKTWLYDAAAPSPELAWTELVWRNPANNTEHRHRSNCGVFFNGQQLVGDWETGKVYSLEMDTYTDNADPILRLRRSQTMSDEGMKMFFAELRIDMETGVGTASGDGSDPQLLLRYSDDAGHSWSSYKSKSMGLAGEYKRRVKFGPTGYAVDRVWEISTTSPVAWSIFGATARVTKGTS